MMARLGALMGDPDRILELANAGLSILLAQEEVDPRRVAAIGYCFGGTMALELARSGADLAAVVGFHSGLQTQRPARGRRRQGRGPGLHRRRRSRWSRPSNGWPSNRRCGPRTSIGA